MFLRGRKDGGPESTVTGYWLVEAKRLFSVVLLKFEGSSRDAFHDHAFNSVSWVIRGRLRERHLPGSEGHQDTRILVHRPSLRPIVTRRDTFHKVDSVGTTWVLSFRGPWATKWHELVGGETITLTDGRRVLSRMWPGA